MAGTISVLRNPVIGSVSSRLESRLKSHFDLNSCSHGVNIEVKQVDDNYIWFYYENQYLYVELSGFRNYG